MVGCGVWAGGGEVRWGRMQWGDGVCGGCVCVCVGGGGATLVAMWGGKPARLDMHKASKAHMCTIPVSTSVKYRNTNNATT